VVGVAEARVTDGLPAERPRSARETLQGRIVALVRAGTCPQVAAAAVGVNRRTFRKWLERGGLKPGSREGQFVRALAEAEALLETLLVQQVVAQAKADAKMALKYLERRHPDRWRKATEQTQQQAQGLVWLDDGSQVLLCTHQRRRRAAHADGKSDPAGSHRWPRGSTTASGRFQVAPPAAAPAALRRRGRPTPPVRNKRIQRSKARMTNHEPPRTARTKKLFVVVFWFAPALPSMKPTTQANCGLKAQVEDVQ
jgi:hypothetical protein